MDTVLVTTCITTGGAFAGAALGYLGGLQKGKADLRVERERSQQLREDRAEEHLKHRMAAYHDVLNSGTEAARVIAAGGSTLPYINTKVAELEKQVNGILAFGATGTHEPAQAIVAALRTDGHVTSMPMRRLASSSSPPDMRTSAPRH